MCQAGFDVVDVYPLTDSYPGGTVDEVHYPNKVFDAMERMLEKYKVHNNTPVNINTTERRIKRCVSWYCKGTVSTPIRHTVSWKIEYKWKETLDFWLIFGWFKKPEVFFFFLKSQEDFSRLEYKASFANG